MFSATDAADAGADAGASAPPDVGAAPTVGAGGEPAATPAPGDVQANVVTVPGKDVQDGDTSGTSGTTAAPVGRADAAPPAEAANPPTVPLVVVSTCLYRELMELHTLSFFATSEKKSHDSNADFMLLNIVTDISVKGAFILKDSVFTVDVLMLRALFLHSPM